MCWESMESAPTDGSLIQLKGTRPRSDTVEEIVGQYDEGGYTEGWVDERGNWFYPTQWRPINKLA